MARPSCREHPRGRVRRDGYYGRHGEFIRWECVPDDDSPAHYLRQNQMVDLPLKLVGGPHGSCPACGRPWEPGDGLPSAHHDNFVLRAKAEALVEIARGGQSLRGAAHEVRMADIERRTGRRPPPDTVTRDGRLARDWVPQYADIIAAHYLPREWPPLIAVASFEVRTATSGAHGKRQAKGKHLYSLLAAVAYGPGKERGQLWHVAAFAAKGEGAFREFFRQLGGQPEAVVCEGGWAIRSAAAWAFPKSEVYPSARYLYGTLREHVRRANLQDDRHEISQALSEGMFLDPASWHDFERVLDRHLEADFSRADPKLVKGIEDISKWRRRNRQAIDRLLSQPYSLRDLERLEKLLDTIGHRLGVRRRMFRNLHRLNCVLRLMTIELRGEASTDAWAQILQDHHRAHQGKPPPRRAHDGDLLRPD